MVLREDPGPFVLLRDGEEGVRAGRQRGTVDLDVVRGRKDCVLVGADAPRAFLAGTETEIVQAPGHQRAPDLSAAVQPLRAVNVRAAVVDRDFDETDLLRDAGSFVTA